MTKTSLTDYATPNETLRAAAERALSQGLTLGKYADPTEDAREGLTADEAADVAREDVSLVYVVLSCVSRRRWAVGDRVEAGDIPADYDTGRVSAVVGDAVTVHWDSGVATGYDASDLRPEGEDPVLDDEDEDDRTE